MFLSEALSELSATWYFCQIPGTSCIIKVHAVRIYFKFCPLFVASSNNSNKWIQPEFYHAWSHRYETWSPLSRFLQLPRRGNTRDSILPSLCRSPFFLFYSSFLFSVLKRFLCGSTLRARLMHESSILKWMVVGRPSMQRWWREFWIARVVFSSPCLLARPCGFCFLTLLENVWLRARGRCWFIWSSVASSFWWLIISTSAVLWEIYMFWSSGV